MMMVAVLGILNAVMITIIGCLYLTNICVHCHFLFMRLTRGHGDRCQPLQREADQYRQKRDQSCQFGMHVFILHPTILLEQTKYVYCCGQFCLRSTDAVRLLRAEEFRAH